jgi:L-2,4-diaminobutyrate decarboxylase
MEVQQPPTGSNAHRESAPNNAADVNIDTSFRGLLLNFRRERFLDQHGTNLDILIDLVSSCLRSTYALQAEGVTTLLRQPISVIARDAKIPTKSVSAESLITALGENTHGALRAADPFTVKNIIPLPNLSGLATHLAASTFMANGVTGEDAGVMLNAEIACAAAISKLVGYNCLGSAGLFTFGGTGTNLYGAKIGLAKAAPEHFKHGIPQDVYLLTPYSGHYSHETAANWLGIGSEKCLRIKVHSDQTTDLDDLEKTCRSLLIAGKRIGVIFALGGTTSNCAIDDIKAMSKMRDRLVVEFDLSYTPHIHLDSVLGWSFASFREYDSERNILDFSPEVLQQIAVFNKLTANFRYADSLGIDFHKTGFIHYNSSMFLVQAERDMRLLKRDSSLTTPLFHDKDAYNPGKYSLETSRSSANILATWVALQNIGIEGYHLLLGNALENGRTMRSALTKLSSEGIAIVNDRAFGCDIFIRCYQGQLDGLLEFEREKLDISRRKSNSKYLDGLFKFICDEKVASEDRVVLSKSSAACYLAESTPLSALRIYSLNPYLQERDALEIVKRILRAKNEYDRILSVM